eukprot:9345586-Pyramimonas_sp.AAC.1
MEARHALVRNYPPDCSGDRDCHICACDVNALPYRARRRAMRRCGTGVLFIGLKRRLRRCLCV